MPRGVTLGVMLDALRAEAGFSSKVSLSVNMLPMMKQMLQRTQRRLYNAYDWPFKYITRDVLTQAGQRYYNFPADLDPEKTIRIWYRWGSDWLPLSRGITIDYYSAFDSDNGARNDPTQRWEMRDNATGTGNQVQVELWPVPATNGTANASGTLRFEGTKDLAPLVADADVCDIDSDLIVLFTAAEILADKGAKSAAAKQTAAQGLLADLVGGLKGRRAIPLGEGVGYRGLSKRRQRILVASRP